MNRGAFRSSTVIQAQGKISFKWLVKHSADIVNRHTSGHDGKVPLQRLNHRFPKPIDIEFGEQVWAKVPTYVNRRKRSLQPRAVPGTWLGLWPRTGQNIVALSPNKVVRVRTVNRRPEAERLWSPPHIS